MFILDRLNNSEKITNRFRVRKKKVRRNVRRYNMLRILKTKQAIYILLHGWYTYTINFSILKILVNFDIHSLSILRSTPRGQVDFKEFLLSSMC